MTEITARVAPQNIEVLTFGAWRGIVDSQGEMNVEQLPFGKLRPQAANDRIVTVEYLKPDCGSASECSDISFDCTDVSDDVETHGYDRLSIDSCTGAEFSVDHDYFTDNCIGLAEDLMHKMRAALRKMVYAENVAAINYLLAQAGNYFALSGDTAQSSTASPYALPVLNASFEPQPMGFFPLINQYQEMGVGDREPYVVSGSLKLKGYAWADMKGIFSQGQDDGINPNFMTIPNFYYDKLVDGTVGTSDYAFSFIPGSIANLSWHEFDNPDASTTPDGRKVWAPIQAAGRVVRQKIDIGAPFGVSYPVDAMIYYDDCNNKVNFKFRRYYDFWRIPDDAFVDACNQKYNYILAWTIAAEALDSSDFSDILGS